MTLEDFLGQIDLGDLRSMIENDSDYGEEDDEQASQSHKSNIKM